MNLSDQLTAFARWKHSAVHLTLGELECRQERVLAMAEQRLKDGFANYGDATWRKSPDDLEEEILEELADALVYASILLYLERGMG